MLSGLGLTTVLILHWFPPERYPFYPRCGLYALTGLHCPGCGSLRAIHHLTRAEFQAALHANALLMLTLPALLVIGLVRWWHGRRPWPRLAELRPGWFWLAAGVIILFGVLRNLPVAPLNALAPGP